MKFLCDRMLGTLAKWLRIYGFDTIYVGEDASDNKLIEIAKNEDRVLITRDKNLTFNARRGNIKVLELRTTDIDEQIKEILKDIKIDEKQFLSRCLLCNSLVEGISKKDVEKRVPEKVFENNNKFWYCKNCDKIYWRGSHFKNMMQKIKQL